MWHKFAVASAIAALALGAGTAAASAKSSTARSASCAGAYIVAKDAASLAKANAAVLCLVNAERAQRGPARGARLIAARDRGDEPQRRHESPAREPLARRRRPARPCRTASRARATAGGRRRDADLGRRPTLDALPARRVVHAEPRAPRDPARPPLSRSRRRARAGLPRGGGGRRVVDAHARLREQLTPPNRARHIRAHGALRRGPRRRARIAAGARWVRIDLDALGDVEPGPPPALDPVRHYLEGPSEDVAAYLLTLDAINFGSGWFPTLRKRPGCRATSPSRGRSPTASARRAVVEREQLRALTHRRGRRRASASAATTSSWRSSPRRCASSGRSSASAPRWRSCARPAGRPSASPRRSPAG